MRRVSFILSMLMGFIVMYGSIGSSDLGLINNGVLITRVCFGVFLMYVGYAGLSESLS